MKIVRALSKVMMVEDDGRINAPFSFFLNTHKNPNTQDSICVSLKLFHLFLAHFKISLVDRALAGRCLEEREMVGLISLSFRPLFELNDRRRIAKFIDVKNAEADEDRDGAVEGGTASQRLKDVAAFLKYYESLVADRIRSADTRERLAASYKACSERLQQAVGDSVNGSAYDIRALSSTDFVKCMKVVYSHPKVLLGSTKSEMHLMRDRAMFMLSCEGLRPGEICNLRVNDLIKGPNGLLSLQVVVNKKHRKVVKSSTPLPKGASSNTPYATVRMIHLWPFTRDALNDYINNARSAAIAMSGEDRTSGFVFIKSTGDPVTSRQAVSLRFSQMCDALQEAGHMKIESVLFGGNKKNTALSCYTMRHSAASYFYLSKMNELENKESVFDLMRARFGWTDKSDMPGHYAKRGIVEIATVEVNQIYTEMRAEVDRRVRPITPIETHFSK
ncbi:DNA_BRE_C domain containing protein [Comamonadaceae bacterium]